MNVSALSLPWRPFKMNQFQFLRSVRNLPDGSSTIPNCWTNDGMLSSSKRTHSTFFWDVRDFRTKNVCTGKTQAIRPRNTSVWTLLCGACAWADPWWLPLQYVQGSGRVDWQLEPDRDGEQEAVQDADAPQRSSSPVMSQDFLDWRLRRLREIIKRFFLLCHLHTEQTPHYHRPVTSLTKLSADVN